MQLGIKNGMGERNLDIELNPKVAMKVRDVDRVQHAFKCGRRKHEQGQKGGYVSVFGALRVASLLGAGKSNFAMSKRVLSPAVEAAVAAR